MATSPDAIRDAIGAQTTLGESIAALLRAICSQIYGGPDAAKAFADNIVQHGAAWAACVPQNTPYALETSVLQIDESKLPSGTDDAFLPLDHWANLPPVPPPAPPVNVDVPYVSQTGTTLNCTMGNWQGEPTSYRYQWEVGGAPAGTDSNTYDVQSSDVGEDATCVVTAVNAGGETTAPPSNVVAIA